MSIDKPVARPISPTLGLPRPKSALFTFLPAKASIRALSRCGRVTPPSLKRVKTIVAIAIQSLTNLRLIAERPVIRFTVH